MSNLTPQEIAQYRLIKKIALPLMLMFRLDRPVGPVEIAAILEIDRTTASKYLTSAVDLGFATRTHHHEGFMLTQQGRQLILPFDFDDENQMRRISTFEATTTALKTLGESNKPKLINQEGLEAVVVDPESGKNPHFTKNIAALKAAGVGEPMRSKLAAAKHVTPEYVQAHAAKVKQEGKRIGMLVHRLRAADPMPAVIDPEDTSRYVTGKYASAIEH